MTSPGDTPKRWLRKTARRGQFSLWLRVNELNEGDEVVVMPAEDAEEMLQLVRSWCTCCACDTPGGGCQDCALALRILARLESRHG